MTTTKTGQRSMSLPMDNWKRQWLSWLLLSMLLTTVLGNGNNNNYHSNLLSSSSSPSASSLYSSPSTSSSSSSNPGSYYSFPLNIIEAAKLYQTRSNSGSSSPAIVNFLQQYQQQPQQQQESLASAVRRSQQDAASMYNQPETFNLSPAMQQLASSLLAASAQSVASFESPPVSASAPATASADGQQNYSSGFVDASNAALAESAFYSNPTLYNYFLSAQQYYPSDPSAAYTLSPAALEQYTAAFLQAGNGSTLGSKHSSVGVANGQNSKVTGANKQGLGRRIGELVSNSAERASRAFKSFSQFKLFNDIKPSRLLGLVSDQQHQQSADGKTLVNSSAASMVASPSSPSSAWYFPPSSQVAAGIPVANPWSSAAYGGGGGQVTPPVSPSFYQQPVYVRTQDVNSNQAAAAAVAAQKGADYLSSMSEFYPQKLSSLDGSGAVPFAPSPPNANIALSGSTTVYHHYGPSSLNGGGGSSSNGNSQHSDLFAAPQTQFGVRMKPPKDFDFDSSNEDEMSNSSAEQDDAKMADNGSSGSNGGRNNLDNGGGDGSSSGGDRFNERPSNGGGGGNSNGNSGSSGPWSSGQSSFDEYSEPNSGVEPDLFNAYNPNVPNNGQRFRPFNTGHSGFRPVAPNAFHASVPNLRPYLSGIRRPTPLAHSAAEFDDTDSWYNTFFGTNVKPMTRLRGVPFANNAPMAAAFANSAAHNQFSHQAAAHHHQPHSLLNSAASTQTPTSLSPDNYFGSAAGAHHHPHHHQSPHQHYFQTAYNRPVWPGYSTPMYPGAASPYFRPNPLLAGAATHMRPVTMPYNPYFMAPRYPQAHRPAMFAAYPTASPMMMAAARYPTAMSPYSMMPSASTLYPVRVPFTPMMPMGNPFAAMAASSLIPTIAQPPIMRYRIGTDLTPSSAASSPSSSFSSPAVSTIRRTLNITKRGQLTGGSGNNGLDLVDTASSMLSKVGKAIANTLPSVKSLGSLALSGGASPKTEEAEIIVPNEHEANLATLYNAYQVLQRRMETNEHSQVISSPSPSSPENVSLGGSQQQQLQSAQPPPPYYHYYIGDKDTYQSTSTSTTTSTSTSSPLSTVLSNFQDNGGVGFTTEHLVSSARAIPLNFTVNSSSSNAARSIKARHVNEQLAEHEKRQEEIRKFLDGSEVGVPMAANDTTPSVPSPTYITPSTTTTTSSPTIIRTAKAVISGSSSPQILSAGDSSPWRPLLRSAVVSRKRY